ncbi:MAG TPA: type II toxin-antitoxin system VapC family toxin [Thermoanaerobaculia bacterium]|nr:type II toxin-antitoxin system VapC family toxin [Thermoanaerobaculia bacterium]
MVLDTSALLAMLFDEPEAPAFEEAIAQDPTRLLSAASLFEAAMVVETRLGEAGGRELDLLLHKAQIEVIPVTVEQVEIARHAFRTYGKGRHPAGLNYGDCFAYALSRLAVEPLLFKGGDFGRTDVVGVSESKPGGSTHRSAPTEGPPVSGP